VVREEPQAALNFAGMRKELLGDYSIALNIVTLASTCLHSEDFVRI
jgi:hypothetical protein